MVNSDMQVSFMEAHTISFQYTHGHAQHLHTRACMHTDPHTSANKHASYVIFQADVVPAGRAQTYGWLFTRRACLRVE